MCATLWRRSQTSAWFMSLTMIAMCWNQRSLLHQILGPMYAEGVLHGPRGETRRTAAPQLMPRAAASPTPERARS